MVSTHFTHHLSPPRLHQVPVPTQRLLPQPTIADFTVSPARLFLPTSILSSCKDNNRLSIRSNHQRRVCTVDGRRKARLRGSPLFCVLSHLCFCHILIPLWARLTRKPLAVVRCLASVTVAVRLDAGDNNTYP